MCGIVGFTGKPDQKLLKSMNDLIHYRGPDDEGFFSDGTINLAMRRLSIIDLQTGRQPMCNEDKSIWVVYNGEIYNFKSLRDELLSIGHTFQTHCDTEVIVHGYEQWGEDFVHRLNGMFAIALWHAQKKRLILYRDRLGIKPLFYCHSNGRLLFSSEIKSLLINPDFTKEIDFESLHYYFSCKNVPAPRTIFKNIVSLLPGEKLIFENNALKKERYWQLAFNEDQSLSEQDVKDRILNLLEDSVKIRMVADVPVGAYLSGGVDSSSVVALMRKYSSGPLKTFSLGYEDDFKNKSADLHFARQVAQLYNTDHHEYIMSAREIPEDIVTILSSFSEPFSGVISTFYLSKLIRRHVKVALSGDGADELFGSYLPHRLAVPVHNYISLGMQDKKLSESELNSLGHFKDKLEFLRKIAHKDVWVWRSRLSVFSEDEKTGLYSPLLQNATSGCSIETLYRQYFDSSTTTDPLNRILDCDIKALLPDQVLAFVDRLSMAHSIEVRPPFLDYRLVEFTGKIPGSMKIKNTIVKHILKEAVRNLIPGEILQRPKEGFVLPINEWLLSHLDSFIKDTLSENRLKKHGFFSYPFVKSMIESHFTHKADHASKLWNLSCFQIWYETYFS